MYQRIQTFLFLWSKAGCENPIINKHKKKCMRQEQVI